jgi:putative N6-adenine-specific DNA methylase
VSRRPRSPASGVRPSAPRSGAASPASFECFAAVAPGLEPLALAEARALGLPARAEEGGVGWTGDPRSILAADIGLRIASRVLVRVASFDARSFAELERHARRIPWADFVPQAATVRFRVTCRKSRLYHSDAVAERLADAVQRTVTGLRTERSGAADDEWATERAALFVVRLVRDHCTVSADASGALLHRRGYRLATAKAPLRETVAAALLAASEWDGLAPLVDPLCGSGTIPIEAALLARRIPPGLLRSFSAEAWPAVPASAGRAVREALSSGALAVAPGPILGSDRDAGAIESARANAERAGVVGDLRLAVRALSALELPAAARGWVVTNPPYGARIGDASRVRDLWARLGRLLRERAPGWRLTLLSPDAALDRQLQLPVAVVGRTSNGGIPVRIVTADIPM